MRAATDAEVTRWDEIIAENPDGGHILQTRAWGEFKRRWGWQPRYLIGADSGVAALVLARRVAGFGDLLYVPKGPGVSDAAGVTRFVDDLRAGGREKAFLLKVEPELVETPEAVAALAGAGLAKAPNDVQISRATIIVDIRPDEDALLASFKSKTRYNVRLAAKRGVTVRHVAVNDATVDAMYRLMVSTQARAGFTLRRRDYFEGYWRLQNASGQGDLFFAFLGDEVLAGIFVTHFGNRAWYKDGGSTKQHQELMAPHLLQWEVMRWLRTRGVETYDLVAVPRPSELTETHPLYGLQRFKSGFNDHVTEFVGTWDAALSARRTAAWNRRGERLAQMWNFRRHSDLLY